jgi:transposase
VSSIAHRGFVHLGMDVSKDSIAVAVLPPDRDVAELDRIFHDAESVRRLVKRLGKPKGVWACYEAGPTGYDLQGLLTSMGVRCDVVAPSLIPKGSGDRVKTDRRDARRLAGLHRAGELTSIAIPTPAQEGVRDLCRTRGDMVQDLTTRNRLSGFLLRHSVVWRGGSPWTERHRRRLATLSFDDPAIATTYSHYLATVKLRDTALEEVEVDLLPWCTKDPFGDQVPRLAAYQGVTRIGALCLASEVFDWRRFPKARPFMSFTGLVPGENSTGLTQRWGSITRAGNAQLRGQLCETAWAYQHSPNVGVGIRERQVGVPPETVARSWATQVRLSRRFANSLPTRTCARSWPPPSPGRSPGSSGPRWWPRSDTVIFPSLSARSAPRLIEPSTTRRSTAPADPILAGVTPTIAPCDDVTGALIQRQPPANGFTAISIRVHHRGGSPIHCAPARRRWLARPPPPSARGDE